MHPDWHWFSLLSNLENGRLAEVVHQCATSLGAPLMVRLVGSYVEDPTDFDPYASLLKRDEYWLEWDAAQKQFVVRLAKPKGHVLGDITQVNSFARLTTELKRLTNNAWVWVNFYLVAVFASRDQLADQAVSTWAGSELWSQYMSRFRQMLI